MLYHSRNVYFVNQCGTPVTIVTTYLIAQPMQAPVKVCQAHHLKELGLWNIELAAASKAHIVTNYDLTCSDDCEN